MSSRMLAAAAAVVSLVAPSLAAAHERPSPGSVQAHATGAAAALDRVEALLASDPAAAAAAYAKNRRETRRASLDARALGQREGRGALSRAARASAILANLQDDGADVFSDLVQVPGTGQAEFGKALAASAKGREAAVSMLSRLAAQLPAQAQAGIARAIAAINADSDKEITEIVNLAAGEQLPTEVRPWLSLALGYATQGISQAVGQVTSVLDRVPEQARPHVADALGRVTAALDRVTGILSGIFGPAAGETPIGETSPTSAMPIPAGLPIPGFVRG